MHNRGHLVSRRAIAKLHEDCLVVNIYMKCPRCEKPRMKTWSELSDEEREVVKRLPAPAEYSLDERQATHQWCTRCWYESKATGEHRA